MNQHHTIEVRFETVFYSVTFNTNTVSPQYYFCQDPAQFSAYSCPLIENNTVGAITVTDGVSSSRKINGTESFPKGSLLVFTVKAAQGNKVLGVLFNGQRVDSTATFKTPISYQLGADGVSIETISMGGTDAVGNWGLNKDYTFQAYFTACKEGDVHTSCKK